MKKKVLLIVVLLLLISFIGMVFFDKREIVFNQEDGKTVEVEYGSVFEKPDITAIDKGTWFHFLDKEIPYITKGYVLTSTLGQHKVEYVAETKRNSKTLTIIYNVVDTTPPVITLVDDPEHFTDYGAKYVEEGFSAVDLCDGDLTEKVESEEKDGKVIYRVSDNAGNEAVVEREIKYKDMSGPVITLKGQTAAFMVGTAYKEPGYTAIDNKDGDITSKVIVTNNVDTSKVGVYNVEYSATDEAGNTTKVKRVVYIYKKQNNNQGTNQGDKVIYLTFDDGPSGHTQRLLDVLDKYGVKATFFCVNVFSNYQYMIAEEFKRGHTVAIHSYTHDYARIYKSQEAYFSDLNAMSDVIYNQTGYRPNLVRFPGGTSNTVSRSYCRGIMSALTDALPIMGYRYCDWNVSSGDAGEVTTADAVYRNVVNGCAGRSKSWVLQHDSKGYSVDAVEDIIIWGLANGYTFLPITDASPVYHHGVNN